MNIVKDVMWLVFFLLAWLYSKMPYLLVGLTFGFFIGYMLNRPIANVWFYPTLLLSFLWTIGSFVGLYGPETPEPVSTEIT